MYYERRGAPGSLNGRETGWGGRSEARRASQVGEITQRRPPNVYTMLPAIRTLFWPS